jgi:hypothetical protein
MAKIKSPMATMVTVGGSGVDTVFSEDREKIVSVLLVPSGP